MVFARKPDGPRRRATTTWASMTVTVAGWRLSASAHGHTSIWYAGFMLLHEFRSGQQLQQPAAGVGLGPLEDEVSLAAGSFVEWGLNAVPFLLSPLLMHVQVMNLALTVGLNSASESKVISGP